MEENHISLCIPEIQGNEWLYIKECLDTGWVSSVGAYVNRFEKELAERVDAKHGIATASGTAALHTALLVVGVQPEDEVLVSSLTFIAPANAIRYVGAWPVFIDSERDYWQMSPERVQEFIEDNCIWKNGELRNKITNRRVKAILPVHILGHPADMDPILEIARKYDLRVIEDASESLGAFYKGQSVGSFGDIACFSFNGNKIITTGGGGMIVTDNEHWADRARYLTTQAKDDPIEFVHGEVGYNYRLSNVLAAMGCAQLENLDAYINKKRQISEKYNSVFKDIKGIRIMNEASWAYSSFWLYTICIDPAHFGMNSRDVLARLQEQHIQTRPLWQPVHLSPAHKTVQTIVCPVVENLYRQALSLPCSTGLSNLQQQRVIESIYALSNDQN